MNEELNQAVQALTDEDMAELAGGKLSPKAVKVAKIAGIATAGVVGTLGAAAGVTAIVGAAKYGDGAHYFKEWFGKKDAPAPAVPESKFSKHHRPGDSVLDDPTWDPQTLPNLFKED